jgi:hypothetical protein
MHETMMANERGRMTDEPADFMGNFESNAELARKIDWVIAQIVGSGSQIPAESIKVLRTASDRIRMFIHPESHY